MHQYPVVSRRERKEVGSAHACARTNSLKDVTIVRCTACADSTRSRDNSEQDIALTVQVLDRHCTLRDKKESFSAAEGLWDGLNATESVEHDDEKQRRLSYVSC